MQSSRRGVMSSYTELIDHHIKPTDFCKYLVDGENVAVTIRIPRNLRDSAKEAVSMRGMSFIVLIRQTIIKALIEDLIFSDKPEFEN